MATELLWIKLPETLKKEMYLEHLELALYRLLFVETPPYEEEKINQLKEEGITTRINLTGKGFQHFTDLKNRIGKNNRETMLFALSHIETKSHIYFLEKETA
ncbi:hypothetical protein GNP80_08885 [Aliivibrio fischeri]|uniref:hypothetical protein n=1 Tax=Aliivibrio fischeri TaxID=668 RepID=UPI0012D85D28|nr:hypothetical protein [Aliivibrio fischeri]MUK92556.1 hypothetical protein [Aliivibrio fischeri]